MCIMCGKVTLWGKGSGSLLLNTLSCESNAQLFLFPTYILTIYSSLTKVRHWVGLEKEHDMIPYLRYSSFNWENKILYM